MIDGIARTVQGRAVRKVANRIYEVGTGQWRSWSMAVRADVLRVVNGISCAVQRSAVRQVTHIVAELQLRVGILLEAVLKLAAIHGCSLAGWGRRRWRSGRGHGRWGRNARAHESSRSCRWWCCRSALHGVVARSGQGRAVSQVANVREVGGRRQGRASNMRVRLHGLRVVDGIASRIQRRSIGEVSNGIHKLSAGKWGSSDVLVRGNCLRVVDSVARFVKRGSVRQVADIVGEP